MIGIVIVAHGGLAKEYLAAVEHVIGKQQGIRAISVAAECDRVGKEQEICEAADGVDQGDGVVIVVDMFGSSPSNLSMCACNGVERKFLYGVNLPMLVKLAGSRHIPIDKAVDISVQAGKKYMNARSGPSAA